MQFECPLYCHLWPPPPQLPWFLWFSRHFGRLVLNLIEAATFWKYDFFVSNFYLLTFQLYYVVNLKRCCKMNTSMYHYWLAEIGAPRLARRGGGWEGGHPAGAFALRYGGLVEVASGDSSEDGEKEKLRERYNAYWYSDTLIVAYILIFQYIELPSYLHISQNVYSLKIS